MIDRRNLLTGLAAAGLAGAAAARERGVAALKTAALQSMIDGYVEQRRVPGAVVALVDGAGGDTQFLTSGRTAFDGGAAVTPDTQWRIYSMSKPITAMAVMQQLALGRLRLDQPIVEVLPEFARMGVLVDRAQGLAARPTDVPITVRHLLTHTAGFGYAINGDGALEREYRRLGVQPGTVPGFLRSGDGALPDLQGMLVALAGLPLEFVPGTRWRYSVALDVAGGLLERLTGETFDTVLERQLLRPLGMASTGFWARDPGRLAANYLWTTPDGRTLDRPQPLATAERDGFTTRPRLLSGGGGLVSTARDYARFAAMLLDGGQYRGRAVLPRSTAQLALSNLMPPGVYFEGARQEHNGFGAGGRLTLFDTRDGRGGGSPALLYGWGGAAGTLFVVDRVRQLACVVMMQFMPSRQFPNERDLAAALNRDADLR